METEQYLRVVDHALANASEDCAKSHKEEIKKIRHMVQMAIDSYSMDSSDAEVHALTVIDLIRFRVDSLFLEIAKDTETRDTWPSPKI